MTLPPVARDLEALELHAQLRQLRWLLCRQRVARGGPRLRPRCRQGGAGEEGAERAEDAARALDALGPRRHLLRHPRVRADLPERSPLRRQLRGRRRARRLRASQVPQRAARR